MDEVKNVSDVLIVSYDNVSDDEAVLIIGKKINGVVDIINAFHGDGASEIYSKLVTINDDMK